jgi:hypothetical protein
LQGRAVDQLFAEYASAYGRGERPRAADFLVRAGDDADELATMIDRLLRAASMHAPTFEDSARLTAVLEGEPPILELRVHRRLKRDEVVDRLLVALGLATKLRPRLQEAYHELETAQLDPAGVDASVWSALAEILGANVRELAAWRPPPLAASPAYRLQSLERWVETDVNVRQDRYAAADEVDRLFRGVGG